MNFAEYYAQRAAQKFPTSDNPENDGVVRHALAALQLQPGDRLLDFGCADGYFLRRMKSQVPGIDACGFDIVYHRCWSDLSHVARFDYGPLPLPYPPSSFDAIFCNQVLEHVPDPAAVAHEFARVLRPGGKLWLATPNGYDRTWKPFHGLQRQIDALEGHLRHFSHADLVQLFSPCGLQILKVNYDLFVGAYVYYRWVAFNPRVKTRLLQQVAPELLRATCGGGFARDVPPARPRVLRRLAFAAMHALRAFDELFHRSTKGQVIEVTAERRA